jgi:hypothetical protein
MLNCAFKTKMKGIAKQAQERGVQPIKEGKELKK